MTPAVRRLADAILYEGYVLYPYRASSFKNRHRWTLGALLPPSYSSAQGGLEPSSLACECLVEAPAHEPAGRLDVEIVATVRFLHLCRRGGSGDWEEGMPREVIVGPIELGVLAGEPHRHAFAFEGEIGQQREVAGVVELVARPVAPGVSRLGVRVENATAFEADAGTRRDQAMPCALASAHVVLSVRGGAFVSAQDPPEPLRSAAVACSSAGAWPVLVGEPGSSDAMLCAPMILYDHPRVAPESPGDFFDGTEIDEMLVLRILTLSDAEKREIAGSDPRMRELLARTEGLSPEEILRLHGRLRAAPTTARVGDRDLGPGDRVRLRPTASCDVIDLALRGKEATIATIEQDYEDRLYVTVTIDDDPGRDLGARGLPGHRFFYRPEELEALDDEVTS